MVSVRLRRSAAVPLRLGSPVILFSVLAGRLMEPGRSLASPSAALGEPGAGRGHHPWLEGAARLDAFSFSIFFPHVFFLPPIGGVFHIKEFVANSDFDSQISCSIVDCDENRRLSLKTHTHNINPEEEEK